MDNKSVTEISPWLTSVIAAVLADIAESVGFRSAIQYQWDGTECVVLLMSVLPAVSIRSLVVSPQVSLQSEHVSRLLAPPKEITLS